MFALRDSPVYFEVISGVFVGQKHTFCMLYVCFARNETSLESEWCSLRWCGATAVAPAGVGKSAV